MILSHINVDFQSLLFSANYEFKKSSQIKIFTKFKAFSRIKIKFKVFKTSSKPVAPLA